MFINFWGQEYDAKKDSHAPSDLDESSLVCGCIPLHVKSGGICPWFPLVHLLMLKNTRKTNFIYMVSIGGGRSQNQIQRQEGPTPFPSPPPTSPPLAPSDIYIVLCLRSSTPKYNASTISDLLVFIFYISIKNRKNKNPNWYNCCSEWPKTYRHV